MGNLGALIFIVGCAGAWYFTKKSKDKKKRNYSFLLILAGVVLIMVFSPDSEEKNIAQNSETSATTVETTKATTAKTKATKAKTSATTKTTKKKVDEYKEVNDEIKAHLDDNKGWALGTIDRDGEPTENGEPNPDYAIWLFVRSIKYDGSDVNVQVTADFLDLTTYEKDQIASSAQGMTMSYALLTSQPHVYVYNGENSYGGSRILSANEYKWNN